MASNSASSLITVDEKTIKKLDEIIKKINKLKNKTVAVNLKDKISEPLNRITKKLNKLNNKKITTTCKINDKLSSPLNQITQKIKSIKSEKITINVEAKDKTSKLSNIKERMGKVANVFKSCGTVVAGFAKESIGAAQAQVGNELKLKSVLALRTNATKGQIDSILKLTSSQQAEGVVSDEVQMAGAQQLASYAKNSNSINTLLPAMNNLLVKQKGLNGTTSDAANVADLMGKGLNGQTDELKKAGIAFSASEEEAIKFGTEEERAAMLAKVINRNVGDANKEMASTNVGAIEQAKNLFKDLQEQIGSMVLPYLAKFANWFSEHEPQIKAIVSTVVGTIIGAVKKIFVFIEKHPEIVEFVTKAFGKFKEFGAYLSIVIPPILKKLAQWFTTTILPVLEQIGSSLLNLWNKVILPFIKTVFPIIKQGVISCFSIIGSVIEGGLKVFQGLIDFVTGVFTGDWSTAWQGIVNIFGGIFSGLASIIKAQLNIVIGVINAVIGAINSSIQIDIPDGAPVFAGEHFGLNIPEIKPLNLGESQEDEGETVKNTKPHQALGTSYWRGGLTHINERGGEIVDLPNGSKVIPADKSERLLNSSGATFGNIYITAKGVTAKEVVNQIVPQLKLQLANM